MLTAEAMFPYADERRELPLQVRVSLRLSSAPLSLEQFDLNAKDDLDDAQYAARCYVRRPDRDG